jgi:hypothetical protein
MSTVLYINRESFVFDAAERLAYNMNGKAEPEKTSRKKNAPKNDDASQHFLNLNPHG